jgi:hypothetical protein
LLADKLIFVPGYDVIRLRGPIIRSRQRTSTGEALRVRRSTGPASPGGRAKWGDLAMNKLLTSGLLAFSLALAAPAAGQSQDSVYTYGGYWNVQGIHIEDGQFENYLDYIADAYDRQQQYARRQGRISGYDILVNVNARENEPDLYLITRMLRLATPQEDAERDRRLNEFMQRTAHQASEQSGQRVTMRRLGSNILLQELNLRNRR